MKNRKAGILQAVSSLPSKHGIGDLGQDAFKFVDLINEMGFKIWQILPLNPLGYGNSPYQPYSSYAGDEIYISLDLLVDQGYLTNYVESFNADSESVDYEQVRTYKEKYLREAYAKFEANDQYIKFVTENQWVSNYAIYRAFKKANDSRCFNEWPEAMRNYIEQHNVDLEPYEDEIGFHKFVQYVFNHQWMSVKHYANSKGIEVMGDIPIYVGIDSQDVWENKQYFLLDNEDKPTFVAGVPPDYFSADGQRWGNPIYNYDVMKNDNYKFWINRLSGNEKLFDIIRIDHFRAFDTYYKIPSSCETAREGEWIEAPGYEIFDTINEQLPNINIVVEDLGDLRPEVHELRDHYNFKGMKIIQFSLDPNENNNNFADKENMIIYTGTHDNETIVGWINNLESDVKSKLEQNLNTNELYMKIMEMCFSSKAEIAICQTQDILQLDNNSRMNTPGTVGSPNWEFKLSNFSKLEAKVEYVKQLLQVNNR